MGNRQYFAQLTDVHITPTATAEAANAERFLSGALQEIVSLPYSCDFAVITGDVISAGTEGELRRYQELVANSQISLYAIPSGTHDNWNGDEPWDRVMGQRRFCFEKGDLRFIFLGEQCVGNPNWRRRFSQYELDWITEALQGPANKNIVLAFHTPLLRNDHDYVDAWSGGNAEPLLKMLAQENIKAILTGHWHQNGEWRIDPVRRGLRVITTGALCGWGWNGISPAPFYGLRPGYRLLSYEAGQLQSFWRDLGTAAQINLTWIDNISTLGPRPQVRDVEIGRSVTIQVQCMALKATITQVEWAVCTAVSVDPVGRVSWKICETGWQTLALKSTHLWSEWEGIVRPDGLPAGEGTLIVRARDNNKILAHDAVPIKISQSGQIHAGRLHLFLLGSLPRE